MRGGEDNSTRHRAIDNSKQTAVHKIGRGRREKGEGKCTQPPHGMLAMHCTPARYDGAAMLASSWNAAWRLWLRSE